MILDETLHIIETKRDLRNVTITDIYLSNYFNVVQLNDGSVGACMNYFHFPSQHDIITTRHMFIERIKHDPLLFTYFSRDGDDTLLKLNVQATVISALSKNLFVHDETFEVRYQFNHAIFSNVNTATVIGFGGYMDYIIRSANIHKVHISDLLYGGPYPHITERMDTGIAEYRKHYPQKEISISNGCDTRERINSSELVSITASALCNGTMDDLLTWAQGCKTIIVQGQSGCIYPEVLFKRHVSFISTTIKPDNLLQLAVTDFNRFRYLLEGKLPRIYITSPSLPHILRDCHL